MSEEERIDILQDIGIRGSNLPEIRELAQIVLSRAPAHDDLALAAECLNAVQHLEYHQHPDDGTGSDLFQRVDYTIAYGGNCEDLGSVLVALYTHLRFRSIVLWIPQRDKPLNHVSVVVRVRGRWGWADPTVGGATLTESAYQAIKRLSLASHPADLSFRAARTYRSRV